MLLNTYMLSLTLFTVSCAMLCIESRSFSSYFASHNLLSARDVFCPNVCSWRFSGFGQLCTCETCVSGIGRSDQIEPIAFRRNPARTKISGTGACEGRFAKDRLAPIMTESTDGTAPRLSFRLYFMYIFCLRTLHYIYIKS